MVQAKPGQTVCVLSLGPSSSTRRRLIDMGILPGTVLTIKRIAPFGSPYLMEVRGYEVALRKQELQQIQAKEVHQYENCPGRKPQLRKNHSVQPSYR